MSTKVLLQPATADQYQYQVSNCVQDSNAEPDAMGDRISRLSLTSAQWENFLSNHGPPREWFSDEYDDDVPFEL